jgi:hypothetical protein
VRWATDRHKETHRGQERSSEPDTPPFRTSHQERSERQVGDGDDWLRDALAELGRRRAWGQISQRRYEAERAALLAPPTLLAPAAERDLEAIPRDQLDGVRLSLHSLGVEAPGCDVRAVGGRPPWLRQRSGDWYIVYRPSREEEPGGGWIVARIVNARDVETIALRMRDLLRFGLTSRRLGSAGDLS